VELQQYANLVNSIAEPAFVCDRHGRLRLINPALLATAGYSDVHELLGRPLDQILSPSEGINALLIRALRVGWLGEYHLRRSSGALIPISLALRPLLPSGDSRLALAGTAHDLSEEKRRQADLKRAYEQIAADRAELERLNAQLELKVAEKTASLSQAYSQLEEQNRELQQLDEMKTDFVSMVSHELRAPLTNINGGIELLLTGRYDLAQRVRQNLVLVQAEIRRLTRFVETILDLSALEAGRLPLYPGPVALQDLVSGLRAQLNQERISWQIPAGLPPLLADEQALTSVLFHLLDNALKYAPQGKISVTARSDGERAWIEVSDEGPGIPPEKVSLLFDRFYRASPADSQTVYGHGLGLYIVRRLMEAMHGDVQASNRPEGGASFTLCLELAPKEEEDAG
jgi:PAS domain S-box-containing protein